MTISLKHAFTSAIADGADASKVRASNWNAEHALTMATARVLGRLTAGGGVAEELTAAQIAEFVRAVGFAANLTVNGGIFFSHDPTLGPTASAESNTLVPAAANLASPSAVLAIGAAGLVTLTNTTTWATAAYIFTGPTPDGIAYQSSVASFVNPTTTPASGKISFAYDGSTGARIYNNTASLINFRTM
jgi:hypothetical protein